ncbi:MAG: flavodoxin domain-containing protein [Clostridium sp.]
MDGKVVVLYSSKYGGSKKYAELISKKLNSYIFDINNFDKSVLMKAETIIFGAGVYAGSVNNIKMFGELAYLIQGKRFIVFTCGLTDRDDNSGITLIDNNLNKALKELEFKYYYYMGKIDYAKLNFIDKIIMKVLVKSLSKKSENDLTKHDKLILSTYGQVLDLINEDSIEDLIKYVRGV